jgi:hypothetical protein
MNPPTKPNKRTGTVSLVLAFGLAGTLACVRYTVHHLAADRAAQARSGEQSLEAVDLPPIGSASLGAGECRLLLDAKALARLSESARLKTAAWNVALARADEALATNIDSGYQGFQWADTVADESLVWRATKDSRYAEGALRYLRALLDDRYAVGDGKGGKDVVTHDSGYGIRTFGAYTALGYDWLRDAPGFDAGLKARALERLEQWLEWYQTDGYLRDKPISNYYWGYLTTLSFAGLAASDESALGKTWLAKARQAFAQGVLPTFRSDLAGGGWPEGWQYGEYTSVEIALVSRAFMTGARLDLTSKLPWLSQMVTYHVHALLPGAQSVYDGGTWGEHPAKPSAIGLAATVVALEGIDDTRAAEARWMIAHALPPITREQAWVGLLADRPGAAERSPYDAAPKSVHLSGTGLTLLRSDWSPNAVWASFQAGPPLADDHQHADQGHFELFRGSDGLLVDGGDSEGSATLNHNTLLVDDGGRHMNYPPNQGVWGTKVRTTRFDDDGVAVVAVGDIGEAYAPSCAEDGCTKRSVERMLRTFAFVRPSLLVVDDRIVLERPEYDVTWAAHTTTAPTVHGAVATAVVGRSRVDIQTLEPNGAEVVALREPTPSGEGPHRADSPWGPMWRIEIRSLRGARERNFLQFVTVDRSEAAPPSVRLVSGDGLRGCIGTVNGQNIAVLFAEPNGEGEVPLGMGADIVVVTGLQPGRGYRASVGPSTECRLHVAPSSDAAGSVATAGGFIRIRASCGGS